MDLVLTLCIPSAEFICGPVRSAQVSRCAPHSLIDRVADIFDFGTGNKAKTGNVEYPFFAVFSELSRAVQERSVMAATGNA